MPSRIAPMLRKQERKNGSLTRILTGTVAGAQTAGTRKLAFLITEPGTYQTCKANLGTAPTGATTFKIDVNKNGTTLYTTQSRQPIFAASSNASAETATADITALAAGDVLTVDIDAIGSTVAGSDLTVAIVYSA